MRVARGLWWGCVAVVAGLGLAGAGLLMPLGAMLGVAALAGAVTLAAHAVVPQWTDSGFEFPLGLAKTACAAAAVGVALAGLVAVAGPSGGAVGLLLACSAPGTARIRDQVRLGRPKETPGEAKTPSRPAPEPATSSVDPAASTLTDEQLCLAWRVSYTAVQRAAGASEAARLAAVRASYLDELERRAPVSFTRWMAAGPRAASDPAPFLTPRQGEPRSPP